MNAAIRNGEIDVIETCGEMPNKLGAQPVL